MHPATKVVATQHPTRTYTLPIEPIYNGRTRPAVLNTGIVEAPTATRSGLELELEPSRETSFMLVNVRVPRRSRVQYHRP
jgi:hypothetical protein